MNARPARGREVLELMDRYAMPLDEIKKGVPVQILAAGGWPYEAIVISVGPRNARVEYHQRGGGHREPVVPLARIYRPAALQALRAERAATPGPAAQEGT